jgi:SAM-dependent methyltransferase
MCSIKDTWLDWYRDRKVEGTVAALSKELLDAKVRKILDFGTGTGRHTVYLAKMGFDVYGFDWSETAISITEAELSKQGLSAKLTVWDMNQTPLPYAEGFFDAVIAIRVLHHTYVENIKRIASEIARITRVGGYLYIEAPTYDKALKQKLEGVKSKEPEPGTYVPFEGEEAGVPHHHFTRDEMLRIFENFNPLAVEEIEEHFCFTGIKK